MYHILGRGEVYKKFCWGNLRERDHSEDLCVDGRIILKRIFQELGWGAWNEWTWLRIGTGGGLL
jgi:hypothetical protein